MPKVKRFYTAAEAAKEIGEDVKKVYGLLRTGKLKGIHVAGSIRITVESVYRYLKTIELPADNPDVEVAVGEVEIPEVVTVKEFAEYFDVSSQTPLSMVKRGELIGFRHGTRFLVLKSEIQRLESEA